MNRLQKLFACLCPALLLATGLARAETVFWSDNFDTNGASHWASSTNGVWKISAPTAGPPVGGSGYRTHSGTNCASSQGYGYSKDARLVCNRYLNGVTSLTVPSADQYPRLRFWHWFNFDNALGYVEISTDGGGSWTQLSPTYLNLTGGGVWTRPSLDLSAYAGQNIQIAFHFTSGCCTGNSLGWFVDDVAVVTGNPALNFPVNFEAGLGDWSVDYGTWEVGKPSSGPGAAHSGTNCAATVLAGNYANNVDSRLISPPIQVPASGSPALSFYQWYNFNNALGYVEINNGSLTTTSVTNTTITTNTAIVLNTNLYQFFGSLDLLYSAPFYWNPTIGNWTNSLGKAVGYVNVGGYYFESGYATIAVGGANVDYRAAILPNPPSAPTNFLQWQGMTWNPLSTERDVPIGYFGTNYVYTYTTNTTVTSSQSTWTRLSPTYQNITSGGLWTNVSLSLSGYTGQTVHLAFHFTSGGLYSAPGWYVDDINLTGPPQLLVPTTTQTVSDGQTLTVSLSATNSIVPNASYTFAVLPPSTNWVITSNGPASAVLTWANIGVVNGVLTWTNNSAAPGTYNIFVKATDNSLPPLSVTNSFPLVILPPTPPTLTVPNSPAVYAGQTLTVTNSASNADLPSAAYTFNLVSPTSTGITMTTNGVLTWTPPTSQPSGPNLVTVKVTDNSRPPLAATNSFVVMVTNLWAPVLTVPPNQTIYAGQTLTVTNFATNLVFSSDTFTFELLSGLTNVNANLDETLLADAGILSWATTMMLPAGTYTNLIQVTDDLTQYTATNTFLIVVLPTPPPILTVPATQTIFAGQPLTVTNSVTDVVFPNGPFTFALLAGLTNADANLDDSNFTNNGVLNWATTTALEAGTYTNVVMVTDGTSQLSVTGEFLIVVSNPPPPMLTLPPTQTVYAGRLLAVTVSATNAAFPNAVYTFITNSGPAGISIAAQNATDGALTWTPTAAQATNVYSISIQAADDNTPPLLATGSFQVIVAPTPPPPTLVFPPITPTNYAGQTLAVVISATNPILADAQYVYGLPEPSTNYWIDPNSGLLTWTNTGIQDGVLIWTNNSLSPGTNWISVIVSDDSVPALTATNSFPLVMVPPLPPQLTVPIDQTLHAGQTLTATSSASNTNLPDATYTFTLLPSSPTNILITSDGLASAILTWTNIGVVDGVLIWTNNSAAPGTYAISVAATDNSLPPLSVTNSFNLVILPPLPPQLFVPANQTIRVGQWLTVTNYATNSILPDAHYSFSLASPSPNVSLAADGVLNWTNQSAMPGTYPVTVQVTDNSVPALSAAHSFAIVVTPVPPELSATLLSPSLGFKLSFQTSSNTTWRIQASTNLSAAATNWRPIFTNVTGPNGLLWFTDRLATNFPQRYYRAVSP